MHHLGQDIAAGGRALVSLLVIASEAKQSIAPQVEQWIASSLALLAMTTEVLFEN